MKRCIRSNISSPIKLHFNIIYNIEIPEGDIELVDRSIAAATYKGIDVPEGPLLPADKDALINSQALAEYHSFIQSVEDLLTDYYDLAIYYKNQSKYNSYYYGLLAKNSDGSLILDFDFTLRIGTHDSHRTNESQKEKKSQKAKLRQVTNQKKTRPMSATVIVNEKEFDTYMDAYMEVDRIIEDKVEIMKRRAM